jgi:hypothetical protein
MTIALLFAATLLWDANTETNLSGYRVHYGTESRTYRRAIDVGNVTNWTLTNLFAGTNFFAVTAYDTDGLESDFSDEVHWFNGATNLPPVITWRRSHARKMNVGRIRTP